MTHIGSMAVYAKSGFFLSILAVTLTLLPTLAVAESANVHVPPYTYFDATNLANHFGLKQGDLYWNSFQDLNKDGFIDIYDAIILASSFAEFGFWK